MTTPPLADCLADTLILRINPLPGRRLGTSELTRAIRVLVETEQLCASLTEAALTEMFDLAAQATGRDRQRILDLKRAVYNGRTPGSAVGARDWPPATTAWLEAEQRRALARSVLTTGYDTCLAQERATLVEAIGSEPFQLSLALTSPQVLDAVRRYARSAGALSKQDRKSERGILQHLTRAMVRTSPLARFTAVGFANWSEQGTSLDRAVFQRRRAHSIPSVDRAMVSMLVRGLLPGSLTLAPEADAEAGSTATVMQNPSLRIMQTSVGFRRREGAQVRVLSTPLTSQLRALLNLTAQGPVSMAGLCRALGDRLAVTVAEAEQVVRAACAAQILLPGTVLDEQAEDPLPAARELLRRHVPVAADELAAVSAELDRIPRATVTERVAVLRRLESAEQRLNALSLQPARLHINEDYVLEPVEVSTSGYRQALEDLAEVTEFTSLFDRHHELRALACTLFVDRFGAGASVPLLDHAADLVGAVLNREERLNHGGAEELGPPDGSLPQLLKLRATAVHTVAERMAAHTARQSGSNELALESGLLAELAEALPERFRRTPASYGLLVQPADGRLILNGCYPGHGMLGARFLGVDRALGGRAGESVARRSAALFAADGAELREDRGLHGININHRIPLLDRTITPDEWIALRLAHDPDRDELALLDADGTPVRPITLGMAWLELLPVPLRLAMWLADTSRVLTESFGWEQRVSDGVPERTTATTRLTVGQVVLQRRRWYPGADFPANAAQEGAAAHLVDLTSWRADHGVPEEVVFKTAVDHGSASRSVATRSYLSNRRRQKPQYADLASALAVRVLPRLLERRITGSYLEEALPGVRRGQHAFEWAVEFDRPAGARFQLRKPCE